MVVPVLFFAIAAAFLIAVIVAPLFIPVLRRLKFGQTIREEGPKAHQKKAGTPTMGGIIILIALTLRLYNLVVNHQKWYCCFLLHWGMG